MVILQSLFLVWYVKSCIWHLCLKKQYLDIRLIVWYLFFLLNILAEVLSLVTLAKKVVTRLGEIYRMEAGEIAQDHRYFGEDAL